MYTVILAGGLGTRLSEYTHSIPKPMVPIGNKPILHHIINFYSNFNHKHFLILMGYKSEVIIKYFIGEDGYKKAGEKDFICVNEFSEEYSKLGIEINLLYTGEETMTGGRVKKAKNYIDSNLFMLTYGDGLCNVDLNELINFHQNNEFYATVTAVRPPARFGELNINGNIVMKFDEKPQLQKGWINGGFFVFDRKIFEFIENDSTMLEREPLANLSSMKKLGAYKHEGFWQCMDNKRDKDYLEKIWANNRAPWVA